MLARVLTCAGVGLDGQLVEVEVDIASHGMASLLMVGLHDAAVQEARERVRTTIKNSGLVFPNRRQYPICGYHPGRGRHPDTD